MKTALILFLVVGLDTLLSCIRNRFAKDRLKTTADNILYSLILTATGMFLPLILGGGRILVRKEILLLAALFGLIIALEQYAANESYHRGPMSLSSFMAQSGMLITVAAACIFWEEELTLKQGIGIALMLGAMALMMFGEKEEGEKKAGLIWFLFSLAWMIACGLLGVLQKVFTKIGDSTEIYGFIFFSFLTSAVFLGIYLLITLKKEIKGGHPENGITFGLKDTAGKAAALSGILYAGLHLSALIGVSNLNASYFFPVSNGMKLILAVLIGAFWFREKLIRTQYIGVALGLIAILLLS